MNDERLDTRVEVLTPENIAFSYRLAGPFRRLSAYLIDLVARVAIVLMVGLAVVLVFGMIGLAGVGVGVAMVAGFVLDWFYGGLFETFWNGQTPGKWLFGLRVLSTNGEPISGFQAILRNVLRAADAMPPVLGMPSYQVGLVAAAANRRFQRLGDLAAGTMVVVDQQTRRAGVIRVEEPAANELARKIGSGLKVRRSMAVALSAYVERRGQLSAARREEIAGYLARPLCERLGLPPQTDPDMLLCAVYLRVFGAPVDDDDKPRWAMQVDDSSEPLDATVVGSS